MSLRGRITEIATEVARQVAIAQAEVRFRQLQQSLSNMSEVTKVEGNEVTLKLADGTERTTLNVGNRIVTEGDPVITDGKNICY